MKLQAYIDKKKMVKREVQFIGLIKKNRNSNFLVIFSRVFSFLHSVFFPLIF